METKLTLAPLGRLSRFFEAELAALLGARVALEETFDLELGAQIRLVRNKSASKTVAQVS